MALTPDAIPHLSPPLTAPDPAADACLAEGLAALESYKKKDPAKGSVPVSCTDPRTAKLTHHPSVTPVSNLLCFCPSRRALQSGRKRADNETKLLQGDGLEPLSGRDPVLAQGAQLESGGATGEQILISTRLTSPSAWMLAVRRFGSHHLVTVHIYQSCVFPRAR